MRKEKFMFNIIAIVLAGARAQPRQLGYANKRQSVTCAFFIQIVRLTIRKRDEGEVMWH